MTDETLRKILAALPGVDAGQVEITNDGSAVTVKLRAEQVEEVFRENGRYLHEAAMATGIRIDLELAKAKD